MKKKSQLLKSPRQGRRLEPEAPVRKKQLMWARCGMQGREH
jgi:hypothetical protein